MPAVTVVGAGVMGASLAWHLTARGCRDVVLIDRGAGPGAGSTSRATGGFRAQYATAINVRLSLLSRSKLGRFAEEVGGDCGLIQAGYLWLATTEAELAALDAARAVQHAEGLREARGVTPEDIARLNPAVRLDGIRGGAFCPADGFISPMGILAGYLDAAVRSGARVMWGTEVVGFDTDASGRVVAARTTSGRVEADVFVNAAGPWAGTLGIDVPVTPLRRQVALTVPTPVLPPSMPMTIFAGDGFHLRVRDGRVMLLLPTPGLPGAPFATPVDPEWIGQVAAIARVRVPALADVPIDVGRSWAGLYEMSPDHHALLGTAPGYRNFFLMNGSSGHGVMHAPALGHLLAEILLDGRTSTLDVSALDPVRFSQGRPNPVSGVL